MLDQQTVDAIEHSRLRDTDKRKVLELLSLLELSVTEMTPDQLYRVRIAAGLTTSQTCRLLGIAPVTLGRWEVFGVRHPAYPASEEQILKMNEIYGCGPNQITEGSTNP